jgi:hypothetical protein
MSIFYQMCRSRDPDLFLVVEDIIKQDKGKANERYLSSTMRPEKLLSTFIINGAFHLFCKGRRSVLGKSRG